MRSRRPRATAATATARPSAWACSRRCGSPARRICAPTSASCCCARGSAGPAGGRGGGRRLHAMRRDKKRRRGERAVRAHQLARRGRVRMRARAGGRAGGSDGAHGMSGRPVHDRGHARREPGPARPARPRAVRVADAGGARGSGARGRPASCALTRASSTPTTRASSSSICIRCPDSADGILLNPGAWTHYAWSIHDALRDRRAARRWRSTSPTCRRASRSGRSR